MQDALCAFHALGLRDYARIDFREDSHGIPHFLEANTLPGMTETSLLPLAARAAGMDFHALCECMVTLAAKRKTQ
jgi:D-alanine-D-alanine ligase